MNDLLKVANQLSNLGASDLSSGVSHDSTYSKVNRLILVGNGFDLAHGIRSSFKDFISDYSLKVLLKFRKERPGYYQDDLLEFEHQGGTGNGIHQFLKNLSFSNSANLLSRVLDHAHVNVIRKATLLQSILKDLSDKNWVDIEVAYYDLLSKWLGKDNQSQVVRLNKELESLRTLLIQYLQNDVDQFEFKKSLKIHKQFTDLININHVMPGTIDRSMPAESICLLNFNYTDIPLRYIQSFGKTSWKYIPIHGQLDGNDIDIQEPVFGFGDELDESYTSFEHENNDELFRHIKSFKYLQFKHYRDLLEYLGSCPFQVYIFGHSCGVSDRTMLNTIFEHKNCISIRSFYHKWSGGDDFESKSYAISKQFQDKALLRAKVVNKEYCEPMAQPLKEK